MYRTAFGSGRTSCGSSVGISMETRKRTGCKRSRKFWAAGKEKPPEAGRATAERDTYERTLNTVLLIDDNPLQLRIREQVLRDAGFEVHIATSGDSALALLRSPVGKGVGAIVSDHVMPGLSGPDLVRDIRKLNQYIPIIIVSGMADAEEKYDGTGVFFRLKPCPPQELIQLVRLSIEQAA